MGDPSSPLKGPPSLAGGKVPVFRRAPLPLAATLPKIENLGAATAAHVSKKPDQPLRWDTLTAKRSLKEDDSTPVFAMQTADGVFVAKFPSSSTNPADLKVECETGNWYRKLPGGPKAPKYRYVDSNSPEFESAKSALTQKDPALLSHITRHGAFLVMEFVPGASTLADQKFTVDTLTGTDDAGNSKLHSLGFLAAVDKLMYNADRFPKAEVDGSSLTSGGSNPGNILFAAVRDGRDSQMVAIDQTAGRVPRENAGTFLRAALHEIDTDVYANRIARWLTAAMAEGAKDAFTAKRDDVVSQLKSGISAGVNAVKSDRQGLQRMLDGLRSNAEKLAKDGSSSAADKKEEVNAVTMCASYLQEVMRWQERETASSSSSSAASSAAAAASEGASSSSSASAPPAQAAPAPASTAAPAGSSAAAAAATPNP